MKNIHLVIAVLICAALFLLHPADVIAYEVYNRDRLGSIEISVLDLQTGEPINHDADVKLYRIAAPDTSAGYLRFSLIGNFAGSGVSIGMSSDNETAAVNALLSVISEKHVSAYAVGSPYNGSTIFSKLEQGVYLVVYECKGKTAGGKLVIDPYILSVPMQNIDGTGWLYDVISYPKHIILQDPTPTPAAANTPPPVNTTPPSGPGGHTTPDPVITNAPVLTDTTVTTDTPENVPLILGMPIQPPLLDVIPPDNQDTVIVEPSPPPFGSPYLPQTGLNRLPVIIMSLLGFALILAGLIDLMGKRGKAE